jgi:hypothetical protein
MAETTRFTIGADVSCTDGACGKVSAAWPSTRPLVPSPMSWSAGITKISSFLSPWSRPRPAGSGSAAPKTHHINHD